jgi:flagellar protein FliS
LSSVEPDGRSRRGIEEDEMDMQGRTTGFTIEADTPITLDTEITALRALSATDRLLGLYELGLEGCDRKDPRQVATILIELMGTLDFEYAEIAEGFQRLYDYCLRQSREGEFTSVSFVLRDLRDTLTQAVTETAGSDAPISATA